MPVDYSPFSIVLVAFILGVGFVFGTMTLIRLWLSWRIRRPEKGTTYECGEDAVGSAWLRFNIRFYMVAIVFLLFEVELVLTIPLALLYRGSLEVPLGGFSGAGVFVLVELLIFVAVLFVGLLYVWAKGDLNWVRAMQHGDKPVKRDLMPRRRTTEPRAMPVESGE